MTKFFRPIQAMSEPDLETQGGPRHVRSVISYPGRHELLPFRSAPEKRRFFQPVADDHEIERIRRAFRPLGAGGVDGRPMRRLVTSVPQLPA